MTLDNLFNQSPARIPHLRMRAVVAQAAQPLDVPLGVVSRISILVVAFHAFQWWAAASLTDIGRRLKGAMRAASSRKSGHCIAFPVRIIWSDISPQPRHAALLATSWHPNPICATSQNANFPQVPDHRLWMCRRLQIASRIHDAKPEFIQADGLSNALGCHYVLGHTSMIPQP